jgi:hypothetical protein
MVHLQLGTLLILFLHGSAVRAGGAGLVVLDVGPPDPPGVRWQEVERRTRAELGSLGLEVEEIRTTPTGQDRSIDLLSGAARARHALAAVRIARFESPASAEIWVVDQVTAKTSFRRVSVEALQPAEAVAVVALSVVELLNASLLELRAGHRTRGSQAPTQELHRLVARGLGEIFPPYRLAVRAGPVFIGSPGGLGLTVGTGLALGLGLSTRWAVEGEAAIGFTRSTLVGAAGTEQVRMGLTRLLLVLRSASGKRVQAQLGIGAGALVGWADGAANDNYTAGRDRTAVALPSAVAAVALCLSRSVRVRISLGAGLAIPALSLELAGVPAASAGRPMLDGSVALEWVWPGSGGGQR